MLTLCAGIAGNTRKETHDDLKNVVGSVVDKAYVKLVSTPFRRGGQVHLLPKATQTLAWSVQLISLHDALATNRKLDKTIESDPIVNVMKALIDEVHPPVVAMAGVKADLVKDRAPPSPEQQART